MKRICWVYLLLILIAQITAQSVYTDTEIFVLDTIDPLLSLISPIGGEIWYSGGNQNLLWIAEDTNMAANPISLWFRHNENEDFVLIAADYENSGSYAWEVPFDESYDAVIKFIGRDCFGNSTVKITEDTFSIIHPPPAPPENVQVDISNRIDAIISWEPVTETINGVPITPDGYIILYSDTPYEDHNLYNFLAYITEGTSFTHPDILIEHDKMFYSVLAYLDDGDPLTQVLNYFQHSYEEKISWDEIMKMFSK
ncbi:MAG: hypothetical protein K0B81_06650 [Candidatus Cloacimonetes bacterium]|nr:hypothetical protein [Candidatus Cloacimonadota bacterium]